MLGLAAIGACLLAILGPSQPVEPGARTVYQLRGSYVMLAKQLAAAPPHLALNSRNEVHAKANAEFGSTSALVELESAPPEGAPTSIDVGKPDTSSEGRVEASGLRVTATKRYVRQWILRSSYASVHRYPRHIATRSRRREKPSNTYAHYYRNPAPPVYARYQIAGQGYGY
jgi:hypothetical protein